MRCDLVIAEIYDIYQNNIKKNIEAIIIQNDTSSNYAETTLIVPIEEISENKNIKTNVIIPKKFGLQNDKVAICSKKQYINGSKIISKIGKVDKEYESKVMNALREYIKETDFEN